MSKLCTKCGTLKLLSEFNKHTKNGRQSQCRNCHSKAGREYHQKNKEKIRGKRLGFLYPGMSLERYERMLKSQNGVCAICGKSKAKRRLHVDHNHNTGKIRGLLCDYCNFLVGIVENYSTLFHKAENYVKKFDKELL